MVKHRRLGRPGDARVVVAGDHVQELGAYIVTESPAALLDETETEVYMAKEPAFLGRPKARAWTQLDSTPDIVEKRACHQ